MIIYNNWGTIEYAQAWDKQKELFEARVNAKNHQDTENRQNPKIGQYSENQSSGDNRYSSNNQQDDIVIFCEHPHVYTLGKSGVVENLLISNQNLIEQGVSFFKTDRGGDITYHGPGQIVGYPIFDLEHFNIGLKQYIFNLEEAVIRFLKNYDINGDRLPGSTGVWLDVGNTGTRKICAIGVKSSRFITMHGLALNINTDLKYFNYINPCGFVDKGVTSLQKETGIEHSMETCREQLLKEILEVFKL